MGKPGKRKKNAGVGVDFKRVKHKVGKKLPRAQNQTDTNFKSRSISMAEQSLAVDKAGQAVTGRNLTLKELLGQCGHYSERVRRDALQGLAELLTSHPEELRRHSTLVMEATAARIADGEAPVRSAAKELLGGVLLPALGGASLAPFVPLLMAHVCAAMTHLAEPIRADALGFLELLMTARPDLVAAGFLAPVLHHFSDLLSKGSRGRSIRAGSLASLHSVAAALERFLSKALAALRAEAGAPAPAPAAGGTGAGGGGRGSSAVEGAGGEGHEEEGSAEVLMWRRCRWPPASLAAGPGAGAASGGGPLAAAAAEGSGGSSAAASEPAGGKGEASNGGADRAREAAQALLAHLLECWGEAGPSQLAEAPELLAAQCLTAILRCCDLLLSHWGASLAGASRDKSSLAAALLKKVSPHFPALQPVVPVAAQLSEQLVAFNVAAAQLLGRFLPGQQQQQQQQQQQAAGMVPEAAAGGMQADMGGGGGAHGIPDSSREEPWVSRLLDWFAGVMAEGAALAAADEQLFDAAPAAAVSRAGGSKQKAGGRGGQAREAGLPGDVYQSALDGSCSVLQLLAPPRRQQLLAAAWALWQRSPAKGASRARVLSFWRALLRDPAAAFYTPTPGGGPLLQHSEAAAWLAALPRYLFELGSASPASSQAALELLMHVARTAPAGSQLAAALQELQPQLAPLWAVLLPGGSGGKKQQQKQQVAGGARVHVGPLASLPTAAQAAAADLLCHFPAACEQVLRTAAVVCLSGAYPLSTAVRLLEVLAAKAAAGAADPAAFCGLLLNVLSGSSAAGLQQSDWRRHQALVAAACASTLRLGQPERLAASLLPPLLQAAAGSDTADSSGSSMAAYGVLQLVAALSAAAAEAGQALQLPTGVLAALPGLMLRQLASSFCLPERQARGGSPEGSSGSSGLDAPACTALCMRLLSLQPRQLLPTLLAAVPGSLSSESAGRAPGTGSGLPLQAVLQLLMALLREQRLHVHLLEHQPAVQAALAACRVGADAAGSAEQSARELQEQLQQAEALCRAVLGE